jgi:glycosyltransferase 2 family protein
VRAVKVLYLLLGVGLLALVIAEIDVAEVAAQVARVGFGFLAVLAIYLVAFVIDSVTWQLTIRSIPLNGLWAYRVWKLRMVGEAFNTVMPGGGMGGEPVKAVLLKKHYGVGFGEGTASLILAKTINMLALIAFLVVGFALMIGGTSLPASYEAVAATGLVGLSVAVALFFVIQRFGVTSLTGTWLSRWRVTRRIEDVLHHIHDVDQRLIGFYTKARSRFAAAVALAFINWLLGVVEVYYVLLFLGHPVSWADAWIIEAAAQLVRTGAFFIPAAIGAQEGTFLLVCGAITGSPTLGVSVAIVRRLREIVWIVWGFTLGSLYSLRPGLNPERDA